MKKKIAGTKIQIKIWNQINRTEPVIFFFFGNFQKIWITWTAEKKFCPFYFIISNRLEWFLLFFCLNRFFFSFYQVFFLSNKNFEPKISKHQIFTLLENFFVQFGSVNGISKHRRNILFAVVLIIIVFLSWNKQGILFFFSVSFRCLFYHEKLFTYNVTRVVNKYEWIWNNSRIKYK